MEGFSDLLAKYIRERGFSNNQFAKACGIDRTLLQKYLSGQRFPSNREVFARICDQLRLSPDELMHVKDVYDRELLGSNYQNFRILEEILEEYGKGIKVEAESRRFAGGRGDAEPRRFAGGPGNDELLGFTGGRGRYPSVVSRLNMQEASFVPMGSRQEIIEVISQTLQSIAQEPAQEVYMIVQPGMEELDMLLKGLADTLRCRIQQLICIDHGEESTEDNLKILKQIMYLCCSSMKYEAWYYYGKMKEHINSMNVLPNVILTSDIVITFDSEMHRGIAMCDANAVSIYRDICREMFSKSRIFVKKHSSARNLFSLYSGCNPPDAGISFTPCVTYTMSPEDQRCLVKKDVIDQKDVKNPNCLDQKYLDQKCLDQKNFMKERDFLLKSIDITNDCIRERLAKGRPAFTCFFTKEGLDCFMKTGRDIDCPAKWFNPVLPDQRLLSMDTFISQITDGSINAFLYADGSFLSEAGIRLQIHGSECVTFVYNDARGSLQRLEISEIGLVRVVRDYMDYLPESAKVLDREETTEWLKRRVEYWREIQQAGR